MDNLVESKFLDENTVDLAQRVGSTLIIVLISASLLLFLEDDVLEHEDV